MSRSPPVDLDMLIMALQSDDDVTWWLDTTSGGVTPGPIEEIHPGPAIPLSRYISVKPIPVNVLPSLMESFIATVDEQACRHKLQAALQQKQADWHFKQALAEYPHFEDDWYAFKEQFYTLQARQWLRDRDLESRTIDQQVNNLPAVGGSADSRLILLSLQIQSEPLVRYVLWQPREQADESTLTAYDAEDHVLAEAGINKNRLHAIEALLVRADCGLSAVKKSGKTGVALYYATSDGEMRIEGYVQQGNWLDQLQSSLALILGLPIR